MNKPGSLPDLTNFHVTGGGGAHADASPPVVVGVMGSPMIGGAGSAGPHQYSAGAVGPEGDDNMGSPYSSVSQIRTSSCPYAVLVLTRWQTHNGI